ncbi:hypothetical protein ACGFR6_04310 [Streptomyces sp. NPDC048567]|uniref:hypothetical protein n=1 Tax=Streptomyces sp. NPDC048567 TaxID=3365570 RepID=UPI00371F2766
MSGATDPPHKAQYARLHPLGRAGRPVLDLGVRSPPDVHALPWAKLLCAPAAYGGLEVRAPGTRDELADSEPGDRRPGSQVLAEPQLRAGHRSR